MKGLILKDFVNLKKNLKIFAVLTVLYGIMAFSSMDSSFFSTIFTMLFAILTLSLYSYDEMAKWDGYALTMPVSREDIVQSKYIMMLVLTLIGAVFGTIFSLLIHVFTRSNSLLSDIQSCGIGAAAVIFFYCITIPVITKLGVEKARLIFFILYFIPFILFVFFKNATKEGSFKIPNEMIRILNNMVEYAYIIVPIIITVLLYISYNISIRIYRRREF